MSEQRLTYLERLTLAIGAPVTAAGIIAVAGFLWSLNNSQIQVQQQLSGVSKQLYTRREAKVEFRRIDRRLNGQSKRIESIESRLIPRYDRGVEP